VHAGSHLVPDGAIHAVPSGRRLPNTIKATL
jgi:hypothetical protein